MRPADVGDAAGFAGIAVEALGDKYRPALGSRAERACAAMVAAAIERGAPSIHLVAEVEGRMAGVVHLMPGPNSRHPSLLPVLRGAVGWLRTAWAAVVFSLLAPPSIDAATVYVDELAVAPWARRHGVGRALLVAAEERARAEGARRLTLMVTADNVAALGLYAAAGFAEVARRRWWLRRLVFGAPGALIMERRLPSR